MKDVWKEAEEGVVKKVNKKKIIITIVTVIIVVAMIVVVGLYLSNKQTREWIDKNIFRKEIEQDRAATIELNEDQTGNIYAFNRYIGILNQTKFTIYGNTGNEEASLDIQISSPIFSSANRFLAIAENKGQKFYLLEDKNISWEAQVDGNISQIYVNRNGYVAVLITGTSNKTVIKMYNPEGKEMFTIFLAFTRAVDVSVSNDNKYLAIAEVDTSDFKCPSCFARASKKPMPEGALGIFCIINFPVLSIAEKRPSIISRTPKMNPKIGSCPSD